LKTEPTARVVGSISLGSFAPKPAAIKPRRLAAARDFHRCDRRSDSAADLRIGDVVAQLLALARLVALRSRAGWAIGLV
jgi:hypothetical protein